MNDRFTFRIWSKERQKYEHPFYVEETSLLVLARLSKERYTVEQCTGLKDKNGNLIYEGDIIKEIPKELCIASYFYDEYTYKVVFWYGRFGYTALDVNYAEQGDTFDFEFDKYDYEVIGNIHENPELMEDK